MTDARDTACECEDRVCESCGDVIATTGFRYCTDCLELAPETDDDVRASCACSEQAQ
jgi:hypothetical protein